MPTEPVLRLAGLSDVDVYADHIMRHSSESGREGSFHFAISRTPDRSSVRDNARKRWDTTLEEPLWGRCFLLMDPESGLCVGHLELRGGRFAAEMHRVVLGMGIERAYTGKRYGQRLIEAAIQFCQKHSWIDWIDLGVFEHNLPARKLYAKMGFVEIGARTDAFRIDSGLHVRDIEMTLRLR